MNAYEKRLDDLSKLLFDPDHEVSTKEALVFLYHLTMWDTANFLLTRVKRIEKKHRYRLIADQSVFELRKDLKDLW